MVMQRWYHMHEFRRKHGAINRPWPGFGFAIDGIERRGWAIALDVVEEGDDLLVRASLPGVSPEDIDVSIEDHVLAIKADTKLEEDRKEGGFLMKERRSGSFHRSLRLPDTVDTENAKTLYENGVLTVTLPKAESKKTKHLKVAVGTSLEGKAS
jgi:HSP20 family protein